MFDTAEAYAAGKSEQEMCVIHDPAIVALKNLRFILGDE
jgi:hypothetical protein